MRSDNPSKQIRIGAILSYANVLLGNLIPLFYTPVMLSLMGQAEYGLYKMGASATSYISLTTLGLASAVNRFLIKERTQGGQEAEENTFGLFYVIFQIVAAAALVLGLIISANIGIVYGSTLNSVELRRIKIVIAVLALNMALGFSATPYTSIVTAHERFIFIQAINILSTVGGPVINLILLHMGYRSIGMAMAALGLNVVVRAAYILYVSRSMKVFPRFRSLPTKMLRDIFSFSVWIFVSDIVGRIYDSTDIVIIGATPGYGANSVAVYSIGFIFPTILLSLAQVMPVLFNPTINKMVFTDRSDRELSDMIIRVGRIQAFVVVLICSGFIAFGRPFIEFYAGPAFKEAYWVAVIIMLPDCIPLVQSAAHSLIRAKNMHRFRSMVYTLIALINVALTILLVKKLGIIGAAIPTGGAYLLGNGLLMNWYYWKKVHIDIPRFWRSVLPVFAVGALMAALMVFVAKWIDFYVFWHMLAGILVYTAVYVMILWVFVFDTNEKAVILETLRRSGTKD